MATVSDFDVAKQYAAHNLDGICDTISELLRVNEICVVGGAVRDVLLGNLVGRNIAPKDFDLILPNPLQLKDNTNILWYQKNSLGGTKIMLRDFGIVDVFQQYTKSPQDIIANYFDFNCNSLFYKNGRVQESVLFRHFLETSELYVYNPQFYRVEHFVARALKFQILFKNNFGLNVKLSNNLLYQIYSMNDKQISDMQEYIKRKVQLPDLRHQIVASFLKIRGASRR